MNGNANMLRLLLEHLDDKNIVNIPDKHGLNPLFHAIKHPNGHELLALLVSKDYVDLNYPNKVIKIFNRRDSSGDIQLQILTSFWVVLSNQGEEHAVAFFGHAQKQRGNKPFM